MFSAFGIIVRVVIALFVVFVLILTFNAVVDFVASKNREIVRASFPNLAPTYMTSSPSGPPEKTFHAGERVFIHVEQERKRVCTATRSMRVLSFINNDPLHRVVWKSYPDSHGVTTLGRYTLDISIVIPGDLPQGRYFVTIVWMYDCDTARYQTDAPPIPFEVT